ncbi:trypsin alpha-3-like [Physella acuta]|uniref:trypsin alpha-3-like n=1 Tax=Physella acuta TaxID=109671 RepID=UPI0027DBB63F|nr:trypsin alpha-3-like [Physella acuta]
MRFLLAPLFLAAVAWAMPKRFTELIRADRAIGDVIDAAGCGHRPLASGNGVSELTARIVGGHEAVPYTWPAICSLRTSASPNFHICGSNLVKNKAGQYFLITAAHCLSSHAASAYVAHCGIHDRSDASEPHRVIIHFSALTVHASYNSWTNDYDIAVFRISTALPTNNYIQPVCIPNELWTDGEHAIVAGWGTLSSGGSSPYKLHQVAKPIKSRAVCAERYAPLAITARMLCAGLPTGGVDACQGDSGGPLYTYRHNRWTLTGVVSWGIGCAEAGKPGVYADVVALKDWINGIINR